MKKFGFQSNINNNQKYFLGVVLLIFIYGLSACTAQATPAVAGTPSSTVPLAGVEPTIGTTPTPANCLVGIWEVKNRENYLYAAVPVGAFDPSDLKFAGTMGSVGMRFSNDGTIAVQADRFMGRFDVKMDDEINILDIAMNGFVKGEYKLEGDNLTIIEIRGGEMTYSATLGSETMMSENQPGKFLPLFVTPYTLSKVTCSPETLTIEIVNYPSPSGSLEFTRLR